MSAGTWRALSSSSSWPEANSSSSSAILPAFFGDNHAVRRIDATATAGKAVKAALSLNDAVHSWMEINGCTADPGDCPRPMIVAAAGGASRGGFFMASTIGYFLDPPEPHDPRIDALTVRNRLFAISAVSGGAVGAVMTVAAIAHAGAAMKQPCAERDPDLWYGETINNWRDCLEALMAGDFLTAAEALRELKGPRTIAASRSLSI